MSSNMRKTVPDKVVSEGASSFSFLCEDVQKNNRVDPKWYERFPVKRGLRNEDGTGVLAGVTNICNVHGYLLNEGEKQPIDGKLIYRGIDIEDIVAGVKAENRFGFEEVVHLLIFGELPGPQRLKDFESLLADLRELPDDYAEDMIIKAPSPNIMNKLGRSMLALYSYDSNPDDYSLESEINRSINLIAKLPNIMVYAYQVMQRVYHRESLIMHQINPLENTAQSILSMLRHDRVYTDKEAKLLDLCLMLHAEHGGGNNSTFVCRTMTSSGTDTYAAYSAAVGALKGFRHGGANIKAVNQLNEVEEKVSNWEDEEEVLNFLRKIIRKEAGDGAGLIYGMGHAVYTKSDPRARILKAEAMNMAQGKEIEREFLLLDKIERLTPTAFAMEKGVEKIMCANVDLYSGLVYKMLGLPVDLYTPLFAISRLSGWAAHRIEELVTGGKIIRPAYKAIAKDRPYTPMSERRD